MKKQLLTLAFMSAAAGSFAQTVVTDTVILGAGYANQVWYSLSNDEQGTQPKNNWDLGFRIQGSISSNILVNHSGSGSLWLYPKSDKSGWTSVDTTGLSTWSGLYNAETEWTGALGRYVNTADPFDLGWGVYDMGTHHVVGDSLYIIRTQSGTYKKLIIDRLASGTYTFTYANLDGSDSTTSTLGKAAYADKNYAYFSLDTKTAIDREPYTQDWDLVFGQYVTGDYASMGMPGYVVTGIQMNDTVEAVLAKVDPAVRATYVDYSAHTFSRNINTIGYNWKRYTGGTYVLNDSSIYFVRTNNGNVWKLILTGFASADGSIIFSKERLSSVSILEADKVKATLAVVPNPAMGNAPVEIVYHFTAAPDKAFVQVYDLTGRLVSSAPLSTSVGLHSTLLSTQSLQTGTYIVRLVANNQSVQQKLIIQ